MIQSKLKEQNMSIIHQDDPLSFKRIPNIKKIKACIVHLLHQGGMPSNHLHAAIFYANAEHLLNYGRPVFGDTWIRTRVHNGMAVHGIILSAAIQDMLDENQIKTQKNGGIKQMVLEKKSNHQYMDQFEKTQERLSESDIEMIHAAFYQYTQNDIIERAIKQPLYGKGNPGSTIDWKDGILNQDDENRENLAHHMMFGI